MTKAQLMTERIAFEKWITAPPIEAEVTLSNQQSWPGQYREYATQLAWEAWKESRKHTFATVATPAPLNEAFV